VRSTDEENGVTTYWALEKETLPAADLLGHQLDLAAEQVRRVVKSSPFYRRRLGDLTVSSFADVDEIARGVGSTTKEQIIAAQLAEPPYGGLLATDEDDVVRHYVYPAGQVLAWSARDEAVLEDMYACGLYTAGIRRTDRVDCTFQYHWVVAGTIWDSSARHLGAAVVPGGAGESERHAVNMARLRTTTLIGFSTFLEHIADACDGLGTPAADLAVEKIIIVGEWHGSDAKQRLSERFGGAVVREAYGTGETGLVAAECEADPDGMHVHPDVLLEVRDERSGELVGEGEGGEVYLTPLTADAMPVLRFRTGDMTESVTYGPCKCGRTTPRIGRIVGRIGQMLRVKGIFLSRTLFEAVLLDAVGAAAPFRVLVDRPEGQDRLRLQVEATDPITEDLAARIVRRMKARAAVAVEVHTVAVGALPTDETWFLDERQ
jgi:phenylacetate-CoA ligase